MSDDRQSDAGRGALRHALMEYSAGRISADRLADALLAAMDERAHVGDEFLAQEGGRLREQLVALRERVEWLVAGERERLAGPTSRGPAGGET